MQPDTIQRWAQDDPVDFVTTATNELASASLSAAYGPPYNNGTGSIQSFGPIHVQEWAGPTRTSIPPTSSSSTR